MRARLGGDRLWQAVLGVGGLVIALAVWWGAVKTFHTRAIILPAPQAVAEQIYRLWASGELLSDLETSLVEFLIGFVPGVALGVAMGAAMARSVTVSRFLSAPVEIFRVIIPFSLVPLVVVWFGIGIFGKVFVVWYATIFVIIINTYNGMRNVDPQLLRVGKMLGYSAHAITWRIVLPSALPRVLAGIQVAVSLAWVSVIAAEYIGANSGLGYLITTAQQNLATATVMAGMVVIGGVGAVLSILISLLERTLVPYREKAGW